MLIHRSYASKKVLGKMYLPGTFYLSYEWKVGKEKIVIPKIGNLFCDIPKNTLLGLSSSPYSLSYLNYKLNNDCIIEYNFNSGSAYEHNPGKIRNNTYNYVLVEEMPKIMKEYIDAYLQNH